MVAVPADEGGSAASPEAVLLEVVPLGAADDAAVDGLAGLGAVLP